VQYVPLSESGAAISAPPAVAPGPAPAAPAEPATPVGTGEEQAIDAEQVRALLRQRRLRRAA
jgi:hypothetical protein